MRLGLEPDAYWRQTPLVFSRVVQGRIEMRQDAHREIAWGAWHIAALSGVSGKKFPSLAKLLGDEKAEASSSPGRRRRQTVTEMRANMTAWAFAMTPVQKPAKPERRPRDSGRRVR